MTPTDIVIAYLAGGYLALALLAHFEPGMYTERELLGWCLVWPVVLVFWGLLSALISVMVAARALLKLWRRK